MRIINKQGPLYNPADRDHCIQYMTAIGLIFGGLTAADYEDDVAADPRIDALRGKMVCIENQQYSRDYLNSEKRSIANAVQVFFKNGTSTENVAVEYPLGHKRRRQEGIPLLEEKFKTHLGRHLPAKQAAAILELCQEQEKFEKTRVNEFMDLFI